MWASGIASTKQVIANAYHWRLRKENTCKDKHKFSRKAVSRSPLTSIDTKTLVTHLEICPLDAAKTSKISPVSTLPSPSVTYAPQSGNVSPLSEGHKTNSPSQSLPDRSKLIGRRSSSGKATLITSYPPPPPAISEELATKIQSMTNLHPTRKRAIRESSSPYTARRQAKEVMQRSPGQRSDCASDSDTDEDAVPSSRKPFYTMAVSSQKVASGQEVRYPDLRPTLSRKPSKWSYSRNSQHGRRAPPTFAVPTMSVKREKLTTNEQTVSDRKLAEHVPRLLPQSRKSTLSDKDSVGTRHDPIDLCSDSEDSDEDTDVAMFYDCDVAQIVQDPPVLMHDCVVCGSSNELAEMPSLSECKHPAEVCAGCFARWIESELTAKGWKGIACPHASCTIILAHHEVQQHASPETFSQYDRFSMRDVLGQVPNFRWCRNPACPSGQEHDEDGYIFTCVACGHKSCTIHDVDWHEGETCDEYTYRVSGAKERKQKAQEEASIAVINRLSKKCPGPECAFNIQKSQGCDHMTCSRCRYEFCWECLANYQEIRTRGNAFHKESCNYHSSRIT